MPDDGRPGTPISPQGYSSVRDYPVTDTELADQSILEHMIRRPTDADFAEVLRPEGELSGDIVGADVSDSVMPSNDSLGGTG